MLAVMEVLHHLASTRTKKIILNQAAQFSKMCTFSGNHKKHNEAVEASRNLSVIMENHMTLCYMILAGTCHVTLRYAMLAQGNMS